MSTCNRLDLRILGSQPVMAKNLPDHRWAFMYGSREMGTTLISIRIFGVTHSLHLAQYLIVVDFTMLQLQSLTFK